MPTDLRSYGALLVRRWAVVVPTLILVPLVAVLVAAGGQHASSATAQVLLTYSNPGGSGGGVSYAASQPDRNVATQAELARNPSVAQEALRLAHVRSTPGALLSESSVSTVTNADVLDFTVNDARPGVAVRLATSYARAYTEYRNAIDRQAVNLALDELTLRLNRLARAGESRKPIYGVLSRAQERLVAAQAAGTDDAVLVQPAQGAVALNPHRTRTAALIGLVLGIALAVTLAVLMETLDARASTEEIARRLKLPLLGAIPGPRTPQLVLDGLTAVSRQFRRVLDDVVARGRGEAPPVRHATPQAGLESLAMLHAPAGSTARAFRALKANLDCTSLERGFKSLVFTSPQPYRAKPATVANLAVAMAQAGRTVLLCDLGGRERPSVTDLFGLRDRPGLAEVVAGHRTLEEAIFTVPGSVLFSAPSAGGDHLQLRGPYARTPVRRLLTSGGLAVLPAGQLQPHTGLGSSPPITDLVERLKSAPADVVLIDAPPIVTSGEARMMSAVADAVVLAFPEPVREQVLEQVANILAGVPALSLGFVTVGSGKVSGAMAISRTFGDTTLRVRVAEGPAASQNGRDGDAPVPGGITTAP